MTNTICVRSIEKTKTTHGICGGWAVAAMVVSDAKREAAAAADNVWLFICAGLPWRLLTTKPKGISAKLAAEHRTHTHRHTHIAQRWGAAFVARWHPSVFSISAARVLWICTSIIYTFTECERQHILVLRTYIDLCAVLCCVLYYSLESVSPHEGICMVLRQ